ncbi:MAG TPA: permease prefix domain 1-containing protein [Planctomycetota bacterium]
MPNREEALRKIFEAAETRLSDDQKRELLAHLEDAVEAKVEAGVPELEAVGQAFAELGSLKKLRFPEAAPAVATAGGGLVEPWIGGGAEMGYLLLLMFTFIQMLITPALVNVFVKTRVAVPSLTLLFWNVSDAMRAYWPLVAIVLAALAVLLVRVPRAAKWRPLLTLSLTTGGAILLGGVLAGVLLPFVSLIEGLAR